MSKFDKVLLNGTRYDLGGDGGISSVAQALLIGILEKAVYTEDQSTNIANLATELAAGGGGGSRVAVVNNLTNCTSSNGAVAVDIGDPYTATITPTEGYDIDSASVTMGGEDITSTAYNGGVVTISAVTGTIVITVSAISEQESGLVHKYIFTNGTVVDAIDGESTCVLGGNATVAAGTGVALTSVSDYLQIPFDNIAGYRMKIKFGATNYKNTTEWARLISRINGTGGTPTFILRYNTSGYWQTLTGTTAVVSGANGVSGGEIEIVREASNRNILSASYNGVAFLNEHNLGMTTTHIEIGSHDDASFYDCVIESVKIYQL